MIEIREYLDGSGRSPFGEWRARLDVEARRKVTVAVYRLALGNFSRVRGIGGGAFEYKIDFGPGYRVYFGKDGENLVILLGGGTKKRQQTDIEVALARWSDYKRRKRQRQNEEKDGSDTKL